MAFQYQTRLWAAALALGVFASLPVPHPSSMPEVVWVAIFALWILIPLLAWVSWKSAAYVLPLWTLCALFSLVLMLKSHYGLSFFLVVLWGVYLWVRSEREARGQKVALLILGLASFSMHRAQAQLGDMTPAERDAVQKEKDFDAKTQAESKTTAVTPPAKDTKNKTPELPEYLKGYVLEDILSCGALDLLPWKFRTDNRQNRMIFKDRLRLSSEAKFEDWELHQIVDGDHRVTFIFRHLLAPKQWESIILRDEIFNRVRDTGSGPKTIQTQNLSAFINRAALNFVAEDGSMVSYIPSPAGRSSILIQHSMKPNERMLAPVILKGSICTRPKDEDEAGSKDKAQKTAPATPGASGGAPTGTPTP